MGKSVRKELSVSATKYEGLEILKEGRIRLEEENFRKRNHVMVDG
jgi:hypothetical protein